MTSPEIPVKKTAKERAREILAERKAKDPLTHYAPTPSQRNCLLSTAMVRLLQSGNRGGKTSHMMAEFAMAARKKHPVRTVALPCVYIIFAISREQIRDVLYAKLRVRSELKGPCSEEPMIPTHEVVKDHMAPGVGKPVCREIEMKNGNRILFALSGQKDSWQSAQGKGRIAGIGIDEQAGTQDLIDECMARLTELNNSEQIAEFGGAWFMWATSETMVNPSWDRMKKKAQEPDQNDAAFFFIRPDENPAVTMEARARTGQFMSEEGRKIRHQGDVGAIDSFYIFRKQWDQSRHVLPSVYEPEPGDNIWMMWDPGWDHPWALVFGILRQDHPSQMRIVQALTGRKQTLDHVANEAARWLNGRTLEGMVFDPASKKTEYSRGEMVSLQMENLLRQMKVESQRGILYGRNRYEDTLPLFSRYLDPNPEDRTVLPWLVIDPPTGENGTAHVIEQIASYRQNDKSDGSRKGHNIWKHNDEMVDCLVAGTMIETSNGPIPIECIQPGDLALTRRGFLPVTDAWGSKGQQVYRVTMSDGSHIDATAGHRVMANGAWTRVDSLRYGDNISVCQMSSYSKAENITNITEPRGDISGTEKGNCFIGSCGSQLTGLYKKGTTFITWTGTPTTIRWKTSSASADQTTQSYTENLLPKTHCWLRRLGIGARRVAHYHLGFLKKTGSGLSRLRDLVSIAVSHSCLASQQMPIFVGTHVKLMLESPLELTTFNARALNAEAYSPSINTIRSVHARVFVLRVEPKGPSEVFDITVSGAHEFYANGILTHNCIRYGISREPAWCPRPPNLPKSYALSKGMPIAYRRTRPDPLAISAEMSEEQRQHVLRLRASGQVTDRRFSRGPRIMASEPMRW